MHSDTKTYANGTAQIYPDNIQNLDGAIQQPEEVKLNRTKFRVLDPFSDEYKFFSGRALETYAAKLASSPFSIKPDLSNPLKSGLLLKEMGVNGRKVYAIITIDNRLPHLYLYEKYGKDDLVYVGRYPMHLLKRKPTLSNAF